MPLASKAYLPNAYTIFSTFKQCIADL